MIKLRQKLKSNIGYKITNSHFRLGRKLHINDFYYTRRFFQNSFFSSKMAFVVAVKIAERVKASGRIQNVKDKGLTLIGYGIYSELFMNFLATFLRKTLQLKEEKINHNIYDDAGVLALIKPKQKLLGDVIIVVPIASTFSTAMKIEDYIRQQPADCHIVEDHYNVIHVRDTKPGNTITELEREFYWTSEDKTNRIIHVESLNYGGTRNESYFISLPTTWKRITDCKDCFPTSKNVEDPLSENVIFETDPSGITPNIIFEYPNGRIPDRNIPVCSKFELTLEMIKYGHHVRNNAHFFYTIDTEVFLRLNKPSVITWLKSVREHLICLEKFPLKKHEHVLLIASCHYSNAAFISLINEIVFSSAATVIHYDPHNDYLQNFSAQYHSDIEKVDKIFFIDDSLKSGKAYSRINDLITFTGNIGNGFSKKVFACFFLLNQSQSHTHESIKMTLLSDLIYSFANLNLSSTYTQDNHAIVNSEILKYQGILKECNLSSLQNYFRKYLGKFDDKKDTDIPIAMRTEHLFFVEATHRIYQIFQSKTMREKLSHCSFEEFLNELNIQTNCPFEVIDTKKTAILDISSFGLSVLKVMTMPPFLQFHPLRQAIFRWVLQIIDTYTEKIAGLIASGQLSYNDIEAFRFIIRRACFLKSNFLISSKMLSCIRLLYGEFGIQRLLEQLDMGRKDGLGKDVKEKLLDFSIFYCAQLKELFYTSDASVIMFEKRLWHLFQDAQPNTKGFEHFVRLTLLENSRILRNHINYISNRKGWDSKLIEYPDGSINDGATAIKAIIKFMNSSGVISHSSHKLFQDFIKVTGQSEVIKQHLLPIYLWVKNFVELKGAEPKPSLIDKTRYIFDQLKALLYTQGTANTSSVTYGGAFLLINDLSGAPYLVYDADESGRHSLDISYWQTPANAILTELLQGKLETPQQMNRTILELEKDENNNWINSFRITNSERQIKLAQDFLPVGFNRLLLLRLNTIKTGTDESTLGVIGIYFESTAAWFDRMNLLRFILLLKTEMSEFVENHHQKNEFGDYLLSENSKNLLVLSGHGKDMLKKLSFTNDPENIFRKIILNLESIQSMIMFHESQKNIALEDNLLNAEFTKNLIKISGTEIESEEYIESVRKMARGIFKSDFVEISLNEDPIVVGGKFRFPVNREFLNVILFELLINAKKNRWHFIQDLNPDMPGEEKIVTKSEGNKEKVFIRNEVKISITGKRKGNNNELQIIVSSTGPKVNSADFLRLNSPDLHLKPRDIAGGTSLTKFIVNNYLKGQIRFNQKVLCPTTGFSIFSVTITKTVKQSEII